MIYVQSPKKELSFTEQRRFSLEYSWEVEDNPQNYNGKVINIYNYGKLVMSISGYEALEVMGKRFVEEHTKRCNRECNGLNFCWMKGK